MGELPARIGELLDEVGARLGAARAADMRLVWARWEEIVGPDVARHAEPTSLRDGVLRVRATSPVWATELTYLAGEIRARVNRLTGRPTVTEVRVWTAPGEVAPRPRESARAPQPLRREGDPLRAFERARRAFERARARGRG